MDDQWLIQYDYNATTALPEHQICCWSQEGFKQRSTLFPELLKELKDIKTVLDVGCGTGYYCRLLDKEGYKVMGVDYSANMITKAQELAPHIQFQEASGYQLPFKDNSYDLVISLGVLQCLVHDDVFIGELQRVAKKAIILSTLRRASRSDAAKQRERYAQSSVAAARTYHTEDILTQFKGWKTTLVTGTKRKQLDDCFFVIAQHHT